MPTLNPIFTAGTVLQAGKPIRIFGEGEGTVTVTLLGETATAEKTEGGWLATLPAQTYGGPYTMTVNLDGEERILTDIYIGDVYLLGGQSNMQFKMHGRWSLGFQDELRGSADVRLFTIDRPQVGDRFHPGNKASACIHCGACESKCPQKLPIRERLDEAVRIFEKK